MRRNLIAGAVGVPVGVIIFLIQLSSSPGLEKPPPGTLGLIAALGGLVYGYVFWSCFWGFPKVWSWWRIPVRKLYQLANRIEFNSAVTIVLMLLGLFALVPAIGLVFIYFYSLFWVGFFYSFFGGGIYQFVQARKVARSNQ